MKSLPTRQTGCIASEIIVGEKFDIWLQPEVRFIGETGEVNAEETIA